MLLKMSRALFHKVQISSAYFINYHGEVIPTALVAMAETLRVLYEMGPLYVKWWFIKHLSSGCRHSQE